VEAPETRYVKTPDGAHIAYQVFGNGPFDLVYVPGFASNVEYMWRVEPFARGLRRLGSFARVVVFDRRGTGLSDRIDETNLPTLEARMDDIRAVMDAAAVERAALFGSEDGALLCAVFAAAHPSRVFACVLHGTGARGLRAPDYPWEWSAQQWDEYLGAIDRQWGTQDGQVFALVVMAIAASEVVIGLGLVVAMARRRMELDTDSLTALRD